MDLEPHDLIEGEARPPSEMPREPGWIAFIAFLALVLLPGIAFAKWATTPWAWLRFLGAITLVGYLPGCLILGVAKVAAPRLERLTLAVILGLSASSAFYWVFALLGVQRLFLLWPAVAAVALVVVRKGRRREARFAQDEPSTLLVPAILVALLPLATLPIYYSNVSPEPAGGMTFYPVSEAVLHLSVSQELTHSIPPQTPFIPGRPLSYHYGPDLLAALLSSVARVGIPDLVARFLPTLFIVVGVMAVHSFGRTWLSTKHGAVVLALLVFLGEDFSFLPGLFRDSPFPWSMHFVHFPAVVSLYHSNPMLPALAPTFAGLACLARYLRGQGRGWLVLAALLFMAAAGCKIFVAAHLLASMALGGLAVWARRHDPRLLLAGALTGLLVLPFTSHLWTRTRTAGMVEVDLKPWPYVGQMLSSLGLDETILGQSERALFSAAPASMTHTAVFFGLALPLYLLIAFGPRAAAAFSVLGNVLPSGPSGAIRSCLAVFVLLGPLISLSFTVVPAAYPPYSQYNNAVWFFVQSKYMAWVFLMELVEKAWHGRGRLVQAVVAVVAITSSVPSSLDYFRFVAARPLERIGAAEREMIGFIERLAPGEVVLAREPLARRIISLTRCRAPVLSIFPTLHLTPTELRGRLQERDRFWERLGAGNVERAFLDRYAASHLILERPRDEGASPPSFALVFQNEGFRVLRRQVPTASLTAAPPQKRQQQKGDPQQR